MKRKVIKEFTFLKYHWKKKDGLAVLTELFRVTPYTEQCLKVTLEDVKARRHEYAYPEAWQYQLRKYEAGLALFEPDADMGKMEHDDNGDN